MVAFLKVIWVVIVLWSSYKAVIMRYGIFIVVEPHGSFPPFYLSPA